MCLAKSLIGKYIITIESIMGNGQLLLLVISYSKNIFDVKKGESKKVQVTERLKSVKSL